MSPKRQTSTAAQATGRFGEQRVAEYCSCPRCKRSHTLVRLPANFKCADVICDFCGYLAQVKTAHVADIESVPKTVLGAPWGPLKERINAGIYFPMFLVLVATPRAYSIFYLSADLRQRRMFQPRRPLSATARRHGWRGFLYKLGAVRDYFVRIR